MALINHLFALISKTNRIHSMSSAVRVPLVFLLLAKDELRSDKLTEYQFTKLFCHHTSFACGCCHRPGQPGAVRAKARNRRRHHSPAANSLPASRLCVLRRA